MNVVCSVRYTAEHFKANDFFDCCQNYKFDTSKDVFELLIL